MLLLERLSFGLDNNGGIGWFGLGIKVFTRNVAIAWFILWLIYFMHTCFEPMAYTKLYTNLNAGQPLKLAL